MVAAVGTAVVPNVSGGVLWGHLLACCAGCFRKRHPFAGAELVVGRWDAWCGVVRCGAVRCGGVGWGWVLRFCFVLVGGLVGWLRTSAAGGSGALRGGSV